MGVGIFGARHTERIDPARPGTIFVDRTTVLADELASSPSWTADGKTVVYLANDRLRNLLDFQKSITELVVAAEVIGKDPSPWFKTVIIDKGKADGLTKGLPVVMPQGIAGQVTEVANHYAKVMLILDRNSAVDSLVQRTRARGVVKGESTDQLRLAYVLRKKDVQVGDIVVSSGLDGIYPKGLRIGLVAEVIEHEADIFHEVFITPFVDFEKLEEVLVVLDVRKHNFVSRK